jgi:hypothetical protein
MKTEWSCAAERDGGREDILYGQERIAFNLGASLDMKSVPV